MNSTSIHPNTQEEITGILDLTIAQIMRLGIKAVSMDDLSRSLGISKKTLYGHFDNKQDLVEQAIQRHIRLEEDLIKNISANAEDAIHEMSQIAEHVVIHFREIRPVLIHDLQRYYPEIWRHVITHQNQFIQENISDNITRGMSEGYYRDDINPEIVSKLYVAKSFSLVNEDLFSSRIYNRGLLIRQHLLYHLHGLLSDSGRKHLEDFHALRDNL